MIIKFFSKYFVSLLKDINHPYLLQEWKLNLVAAAYEKNIDANLSKISDKKEIFRHDSDMYWPTIIKDTIQWFPFLTIMEHTADILNPNIGLIPSLLKEVVMFELCLIYDGDEFEAISIRYINCKKQTSLYLGNSTLKEMITKFVRN